MIKLKYDVSRTPETKADGTYEVPVEIDARGSTDNAEIMFDCPDGFKCLMKVDSYDAVDIYSQLVGEMAEYGLDLDSKFKVM